jgi:hypothetical protein
MVLFDNNVLCLLLHPEADVPNDPATGDPVDRAQDRIAFLREQLQEAGTRILIPAPVLAEFLTFADADYLIQITQTMWFEIGPFDQRAAVEAAVALRRALKTGQGKKLGSSSPWQKIKVDREIVAIGKVYSVTHVYSTDSDVLALARESGITATHVASLPLPPPQEVQLTLEDIVASQASSLPATASEQPSLQSPDADQPITQPSEQDRPASLPVAQAPQPQGSSPAAPPPSLSKQ